MQPGLDVTAPGWLTGQAQTRFDQTAEIAIWTLRCDALEPLIGLPRCTDQNPIATGG